MGETLYTVSSQLKGGRRRNHYTSGVRLISRWFRDRGDRSIILWRQPATTVGGEPPPSSRSCGASRSHVAAWEIFSCPLPRLIS